MWKYVVQPNKPQMAIRRMLFAIVFPPQQRKHKASSVSLDTYIASLAIIILHFWNKEFINNIATSEQVFSCRHSEINYPVQNFKTELGSSFEFSLNEPSVMMIQADQRNSDVNN